MRYTLIIVLSLMLMSAYGCKSTQNQPPAAATPVAETAAPATSSTPVTATSPTASPVKAPGAVDACTLLTSDELKAVQGEELKTTKA